MNERVEVTVELRPKLVDRVENWPNSAVKDAIIGSEPFGCVFKERDLPLLAAGIVLALKAGT